MRTSSKAKLFEVSH